MTHAHGPQGGPQRAGAALPGLDTWKPSRVATALARARAPEEQPPEAVWKGLREAGVAAEGALGGREHPVEEAAPGRQKAPYADGRHGPVGADSGKEDHRH